MVNCQIGENVIMQPSETQSLKGMKGESDRECRVVGKKKLSREGGGIPGDDNKRDPERENLAVLTIAAQTANVIHIRVTFNAVTRYNPKKYI